MKKKRTVNLNGGLSTIEARLKKNLRKDELTNMQLIGKLFILPLLKHCPDGMPRGRFLESIFHVDTRHIQKYVVHREFDLDDIKRKYSSRYVKGLPQIKLNLGEIVYIRFDSTKPKSIELSAFKGRGGEERIYSLDLKTYKKLKLYIEKVKI